MHETINKPHRPSTDEYQSVDIAILQQQIIALRDRQEVTSNALLSLQKDRDKALLWGIIVLGSSVISLAAWILKHIMKVPLP